jgi:hypothetical protein
MELAWIGAEDPQRREPMTCNIGRAGRIGRIVAGLAIVGVGVYFQSWWGAIGVIPFTVGTSGYCPTYALFKTSTDKRAAAPPAGN